MRQLRRLWEHSPVVTDFCVLKASECAALPHNTSTQHATHSSIHEQNRCNIEHSSCDRGRVRILINSCYIIYSLKVLLSLSALQLKCNFLC